MPPSKRIGSESGLVEVCVSLASPPQVLQAVGRWLVAVRPFACQPGLHPNSLLVVVLVRVLRIERFDLVVVAPVCFHRGPVQLHSNHGVGLSRLFQVQQTRALRSHRLGRCDDGRREFALHVKGENVPVENTSKWEGLLPTRPAYSCKARTGQVDELVGKMMILSDE